MRWTTLSVVVLLAVAGCSGGESAVPGGAPTSAIDRLLAKAPVAADLPAGSTMARIEERGELLIGGSLDSPLLSQQNPGTGEAYVQDQALLIAAAAQDAELEVVGEPFTKDPYGIGIEHGDEQFKQFVNDWLREIQESGLWQDVWRGSIGTVVSGSPPAPPVIGSAQGS